MNGVDVAINSVFNFIGLYPKLFFVFSLLLSWGTVWMLMLQLLAIKHLAMSASPEFAHFLVVFSGLVTVVTNVPMAVFLCWKLSPALGLANRLMPPSILFFPLIGFLVFLAIVSSWLSGYFAYRIFAVKAT